MGASQSSGLFFGLSLKGTHLSTIPNLLRPKPKSAHTHTTPMPVPGAGAALEALEPALACATVARSRAGASAPAPPAPAVPGAKKAAAPAQAPTAQITATSDFMAPVTRAREPVYKICAKAWAGSKRDQSRDRKKWIGWLKQM